MLDEILHLLPGLEARARPQGARALRAEDQRTGAGGDDIRRRRFCPNDRRAPRARGRRRASGQHPARSLRAGARGRPENARRAHLRRAAHGGRRPAQGPDHRDEDGRRQDPRERPRGVPEQPDGQGRARHHGQRLPGRARRRVDGPHLQAPRGERRGHPQPDGQRPAQRGLREGHHLRHEQRVRVRLPAGQHVLEPRREGAARSRVRHRGRDRQHPHRRGAHAAHHLGHGGGRHLQVRRGEQARRAARGMREGPRSPAPTPRATRSRPGTTSWRRRTSGSPSPTRA